MNIKINAITLMALLSIASYATAAVTISGTALTNVQGSSAGTDLVAGRLGLLIVDNDNDGFLNGGGNVSISSGNPIPPDTYTAGGANLSVSSTFYGDTIIARLTTNTLFGDTYIDGNFSGSVASYLNKSFAIVWFETLTTAGSETVGSGSFGIARGGDWVLPAADSGTFTYGGANLDQIALTNVLNGTATSSGTVAFATAGTTLTIIPEPSTLLLSSLGVLALLRRRR